MKEWKFVALWAFILISGELILYGRYYILFYRPKRYIPFKLVRALHSDTLGIEWGDERYGWYYTIQYIENATLQDVSISWTRFCYDASVDDVLFLQERKFMKQMLPQEYFTVWTGNNFVGVEIRYRKGTETEKIEWTFNVGDAVEVIPEEWRQTPEPLRDYWKKKQLNLTIYLQILGAVSLLVCVIAISLLVIYMALKLRRSSGNPV
ncbi:MAG: hypothetical protein OEZ48_13230 [Candidatus Bathyarchaeota archaeon]|nr:hypothetical protein [Candidatus Bathyarchaeota archaeon]